MNNKLDIHLLLFCLRLHSTTIIITWDRWHVLYVLLEWYTYTYAWLISDYCMAENFDMLDTFQLERQNITRQIV